MTQKVTVEGEDVPLTISRADVDYHGDVPDEFTIERLYWVGDDLHGDVQRGGAATEVWFERGPSGAWEPVKAEHFEEPATLAHDGLVWLNESAAKDELADLLESGLSAAEALDYWAVEMNGGLASRWCEPRGVSHQAVSENVRKARQKLN